MRIAIVGSGYVGLVSATCFAHIGHDVVAVDSDAAKIAALQSGMIPIYEPGLAELAAACRANGRLHFSTDLPEAVGRADIVFIAVGTPSRRGDGHADLSFVHAAAEVIAKSLSGFTVIVNKSTVPVGTADAVEAIVRRVNPYAEFTVVSNPEFLREGAAIDDFMHPDRIVVGVEDERAQQVMSEVYEPLADAPIVFTTRRTAELIKYAANGFLAMKISFINEMADLCEVAGADIGGLAHGIGLDSRIGSRFLNPGPGFGGSCFPKDTLALSRIGREHGAIQHLIEATVEINAKRKANMALRIVAACGGSVAGKTIGVLGLAFKAETDDMRDAPSIPIIQSLQSAGARVRAYDPQAMGPAAALLTGVVLTENAYEAAEGADALVVVTEWPEFRALDLLELKSACKSPVLVDLRNLFDRQKLETVGFSYWGIGRPGDRPAEMDAS